MARAPKTPTLETPKETTEPTNRIMVTAKFPPFVDLINDVRIGAEPVEVELHPWLQANIDIGLIIVVS